MKIVMMEPIGISNKKLSTYGKRLKDLGHQFISYDNRVEGEEKIIKRAEEADVLIITNLPLSAKVINSCPKLKFISVAFTGIDHIDIKACNDNDIKVSNSSGYSDKAVAELVFGLTINLTRNIIGCDNATKSGKDRSGLIGNEISGKKFGIIGTGNIGMQVAKIANAFGCELLGNDHKENREAVEMGMKYVDLKELVSESDIISVHVPLNDSNVNLIDEKELNLMKENAILINCARGPIVNSEALAQALNNKKIAGAGVDVFEMEPPIPKSHPLLNAKNIIATPHVAFATEEAFIKRADIVFENILKWFNGEPINLIN
ncbi:MAG: NAD(P)-dependent oxidoreductase [Bacillota bacterium]